jgi:D-alanyl-D-alanine carboxypeptidase (penicillin-binding protein 5/6)
MTVADTVGGSATGFVALMNQYAQRLNLKHTHYINPDGLTYYDANGKPDLNHYSSAADLAQLTRYALANSLFAQIVQLHQYNLSATSAHHAYVWKTTNTLLSVYPGATGVKTGFTVQADYCLVFSGTNGGHHLVGVVMKEKDENQRFVDARTLLDWGFNLPLLPPPPPPQS